MRQSMLLKTIKKDLNGNAMTQEEKQLLLTDLCARLPYGVKCLALGSKEDTISSLRLGEYPSVKTQSGLSCHLGTGQFKPYLRPLSSMTKEEYMEMQKVLDYGSFAELMNKTSGLELWLDSVDTDPTIWFDSLVDVQDWLNKKGFDYRGLIEKGLALEAPEGMYKEEQQ